MIRYERVQILLEPNQRVALEQLAREEQCSFSALVRDALQARLEQCQKQKLAAAAQALLQDYGDDTELTAFTALDGDDFAHA